MDWKAETRVSRLNPATNHLHDLENYPFCLCLCLFENQSNTQHIMFFIIIYYNYLPMYLSHLLKFCSKR